MEKKRNHIHKLHRSRNEIRGRSPAGNASVNNAQGGASHNTVKRNVQENKRVTNNINSTAKKFEPRVSDAEDAITGILEVLPELTGGTNV